MTRVRLRSQAIAVAGMTVVWMLLWGRFSLLNLVGGVVVAVVVLAVFPLPPVVFAGRLRPLPALRFAGRFLYDLVAASIHIAVLAFRFGDPPRSAIVGVPLRVNTDLNLTLTAEAVSLVPGSLIVDVDRDAGVLYLHVLGLHGPRDVDAVRRNVLAVERRIVDAIGSAEERRLVDTDPKGPSR